MHRILAALTARFAARKADLLAAVGVLTELDAFQARAEWSSRVDGVFPEEGDRVVLLGARHPLLDRRLAPLREEVFGENAAERAADAVPLDLEMPDGKRLLLLSGPNAGGKTVVLKTIGLFALLSQSGFALPASRGTSLPVFDHVLVVAGDAQDLLGDLSSFEAAMTPHGARPRERDAEEPRPSRRARQRDGSRRRGRARRSPFSRTRRCAGGSPSRRRTSPRSRNGDTASPPPSRPRWSSTRRAAVRRTRSAPERSGARGPSRSRSGRDCPRPVLDAARERLGAHGRPGTRRSRGSRPRRGAPAPSGERAQALASEAEARLELLSREKAALTAEKSRLAEKARERIDRALEALRETTRREIERLREELRAGRAVSRGALMTVTNASRQAALEFVEDEKGMQGPGGPVAVGELVRVRPWKATGRLLRLDAARGEAEVDLGGKRMKVDAAALAPAGGASPVAVTRSASRSGSAAAPRGAGAGSHPRRPRSFSWASASTRRSPRWSRL